MKQQVLNPWGNPATQLDTFEFDASKALSAALQAPGSLWVSGGRGMGKTHLSLALAAQDGVPYLDLAQPDLTPEVLGGFEGFRRVYFDNFHCALGDLAWERALFEFWNQVLDLGHEVRVFALQPIGAYAPVIPDLRSRLAQLPPYKLPTLSDEGQRRAIVKRARALGFELPVDVQNYLHRYEKRDIGVLCARVDALAEQTLADKRLPTVPLLKQVMRHPI